MSERTGWPRRHGPWIGGTIILFVLGGFVGVALGSVWLGLAIAAVLSIGWLIAYESWRGRAPKLDDLDDDGARL